MHSYDNPVNCHLMALESCLMLWLIGLLTKTVHLSAWKFCVQLQLEEEAGGESANRGFLVVLSP